MVKSRQFGRFRASGEQARQLRSELSDVTLCLGWLRDPSGKAVAGHTTWNESRAALCENNPGLQKLLDAPMPEATLHARRQQLGRQLKQLAPEVLESQLAATAASADLREILTTLQRLEVEMKAVGDRK